MARKTKTPKYEVYGARARPDAYPHELYRVCDGVNVEQLAHGHWFPVQTADDKPMPLSWILERLEKGLIWKMEGGTHPWDDPAETPAYLDKLNCRVAGYEHQLTALATADYEQALGTQGLLVVSRSTLKQQQPWYIVQVSNIVRTARGNIVTTPVNTAFFTEEKAAMKNYKKEARDLSDPGDRVVLSVPAPGGAESPGTWWGRLQSAANSHAAGEEQKRAAAERAAQREREVAVAGLADRLKELSVKSPKDLSPAEFREKQQLKRKVREANVSSQ